jgi:AcrR family transcriptional regulator
VKADVRDAGVRTPKQARSRRTRARILEAAGKVFEEGGYDEATTAEIARRAGVSVGSVYSYFTDKRAILIEILEENFAQIEMVIVAGLSPDRWIGGDLRTKVRALVETAIKSRRLQPGVQRILWERYFKDPRVKESMETIEGTGVEAIERLLHALRERGVARVKDIPSAAFVIHNSVEWIASRLVLGEAPEGVLDAAVDTTSEMISRLIFEDATLC